MRYKGLDLNLLAALEALLAERNVTRAAARLNLSQSATSSALARLREQFGDELLVQAGRELRRTARAEELLPKARAILAQVDSHLIHDRAIDPRTAQRRIRIMASDYVALTMLAPRLAVLANEAPGLLFDIVPVNDRPAKEVEDYSVDLLITPDVYISNQHPSELFFEDDYVALACARNDRLKDGLTLEDYLSLPQVSVRFQREGVLPHDERFLEQTGVYKATAVTVRSHALLPFFLVGTKRIATLQRRQASIFARLFPLMILEIPVAIPSIREMCQWHQLNDGDPVLRYVRRTFLNFASGA